MSLYICIDLIELQLDKWRLGNLTPWQSVINFFSNSAKAEYHNSFTMDKAFLETLKEQLEQRAAENNYANLSAEIQLIKNHLNLKQTTIKNTLKYILDDLTEIDNRIKNKKAIETNGLNSKVDGMRINNSSLTSDDYARFQTPEYRIATVKQSNLEKMGKSRGECYGFTYAMVDPELSPYKNPGITIDLNREIHRYQRNQFVREKDQQSIKRTRLTREYFCPDSRKQAQQILGVAEKNKGKELYLERRCSSGGHACYLSVQDDGKIRYMDPNHGAYLFQSQNDFIDFYTIAAVKEKEAGADFRFYSLSELKYDKNLELTESKTWQGTIRSFLTGSKYRDNSLLSLIVTSSIYMALGAVIGTGIGAALGAAIGSAVPVIGTTIGAAVGAMLGSVIGGVAGKLLTTMAYRRGHTGILSIPHLIQDSWYSFKENRLSRPSLIASKTNDSVAVVVNTSSFSSTSKILSHLDTNLPQQKSGIFEKMISAENNQDKSIPEIMCSQSEITEKDDAEQIESMKSMVDRLH